MKSQVTIPQIVRIIHEELSVRGELAAAEDAIVADDARYQKVPDIEDEYWDREEGQVVYIPVDDPRRAEAETKKDIDRRDAPPPIVPDIPLPGSDLPPGAVPRALGIEEYIPELPDDVIPDAAEGPLAIAGGELLRRGGAAAAEAHMLKRGTDAVTLAQDALKAYKPPSWVGPGIKDPKYAELVKNLKTAASEADDLARLRGIDLPDKPRKPGRIEKVRDWARGRDPNVVDKGINSQIDDLAKLHDLDNDAIKLADELGDTATKSQKRAAKKAAKRQAANRARQVALRNAGKDPLTRRILFKIAQTGGAAALGAAFEVAGAGLLGLELGDWAFGSSGLNLLPTTSSGENISWSDLSRDDITGGQGGSWSNFVTGGRLGSVHADPRSVKGDISGARKNPKKGYNQQLDKGIRAKKAANPRYVPRAKDASGEDIYGRRGKWKAELDEGVNRMNKLAINEARELHRWSQLANLNETSGMAAGSVGGPAGKIEDDDETLKEFDGSVDGDNIGEIRRWSELAGVELQEGGLVDLASLVEPAVGKGWRIASKVAGGLAGGAAADELAPHIRDWDARQRAELEDRETKNAAAAELWADKVAEKKKERAERGLPVPSPEDLVQIALDLGLTGGVIGAGLGQLQRAYPDEFGMEDLQEGEKWIQDAEEDIDRRGTEGVCTGKKFGGPTCRSGTKRYNLAKTFRKMAKKRKGKKKK